MKRGYRARYSVAEKRLNQSLLMLLARVRLFVLGPRKVRNELMAFWQN
jgi:hypothetical protein